MKFDPKQFESLTICDLSMYTAQLIRETLAEADFLPYFISKATTMDAAHLELGLAILGKIGTAAACRKVAEYLVHPDYNVRFIATKVVLRLATIDEHIMGYVVKSLELFANEPMSPAKELKVVLDRPANEKAREIALVYCSKFADPRA